jgi:2-(1,2-epoxy-1,2-dihydrophenyl)acetyl-CoA isomerase
MSTSSPAAPVSTTIEGAVGVIELSRAPHNFIDAACLASIVESAGQLEDRGVRALVLASTGRNFCAGADLGSGEDPNLRSSRHIYDVAVELFEIELPIVAAVQGKAIGAGLGLALVADFRVATPDTQFIANFSRLGFSHGFGMTETLVRAVGASRAAEILYSGRPVGGAEAQTIGLCSHLVDAAVLRETALEIADRISGLAPLAVRSIRRTLRGDLAARVAAALRRERQEQELLMRTADFQEGVAAARERRNPVFRAR